MPRLRRRIVARSATWYRLVLPAIEAKLVSTVPVGRNAAAVAQSASGASWTESANRQTLRSAAGQSQEIVTRVSELEYDMHLALEIERSRAF